MHKITFYKDRNGNVPVYDYLKELSEKTDKDSRIRLNKINDYMQTLQVNGTRAGKPFVDHLEGDIWGLRPLRDRILFGAWIDDGFVLLHHFMKDTQKTPKREIEQAKRELADFIERSNYHE